MLSKTDLARQVSAILEACPKGLCNHPDASLKARFKSVWEAYDRYLTQLIDEVSIRRQADMPDYDRVPTQKEWLTLQDMCLRLTECWYGEGAGNLSRVYTALHACDEAAGLVAYSAKDIVVDSPETGEVVLDVHKRKKIAAQESHAQSLKKQSQPPAKTFQEQTLLSGRSPIDRLAVNNIFNNQERQALIPLFNRRALKHSIRRLLSTIDHKKTAVEADKKIQREQQIETYAKKQFPDWVFDESAVNHSTELRYGDSIYQEILLFSKQYPGSYFRDSREQHLLTLFSGLLSNKLTVIPRSKIENSKPYRYLVFNWERSLPAYRWDTALHEAVVVRDKGAQEQSRLISNKYPYGYYHGLSISSQGMREGLRYYGMPEYEWNIPREPEAFLPNIDVFDPEKMIVEFQALNPIGDSRQWLLNEKAIMLGKNPPNASSIKNTQHHQVIAGSLQSVPMYDLTSRPVWYEGLCAYFDCIQVGNREDGCFYKFQGQLPIRPEMSQVLCMVWRELMQALGGTEKVEEFIQIFPDNYGGFCLVFTPFARLLHHQDARGHIVTNRVTKAELVLEESGTFGISNASGGAPAEFCLPNTAALYDFVAYPGMRAVMHSILEQVPYCLREDNPCKPSFHHS
ncbi:MAG: hypothetical protein RLZ35_275 [Pseudomonadota bacterium]|jgi:hypothetical protein